MDTDSETLGPEQEDIIRFVVTNTPPSRLVEMYYWCQEPNLLAIIRSLATSQPETLDVLAGFLEDAGGKDLHVREIGNEKGIALYKRSEPSRKH